MNAKLARNVDAVFEEFVRAYQDRIFAFAVSLTRNHHDAQEVAQDTFVRAYRALKTYDARRISELSLRAWLFQIALNLVRNRVRRKTVAQQPIDAAHQVAADNSPQTEAEAAETAQAVRAAVASLPQQYRAAIVLRHFEGLSYDEISAITAQPPVTIRSHVRRGLALLKGTMQHAQL